MRITLGATSNLAAQLPDNEVLAVVTITGAPYRFDHARAR